MEFRGVLATCDCFISALAYSVCLVMDGWVFGRTMVFGVCLYALRVSVSLIRSCFWVTIIGPGQELRCSD